MHEDNRIRMWNLDDGRCFNISSTDIFANISESLKLINIIRADN